MSTSTRKNTFALVTLQSFSISGAISAEKMQVENWEIYKRLYDSYTSTGFELTSLPMGGFIAQLVVHRTGIVEVTGSNPVEALSDFFRLLLSNCLNWKIYCDDHSSLSFTTAVQIWIISYILHIIEDYGRRTFSPGWGACVNIWN